MATSARPSAALVLSFEQFEALPWAERQWRRAPWVDRNTGEVSITRTLAIVGVLMDSHAIENHHPISGTQLAVYLGAMAAAFGKSTFGFFLTRYSMRTQRDETDSESRSVARTETVVDETHRQIVEERRLEDGAPPRSLPAVGELEPR